VEGPEETVRQLIVHFLINEKNVPKGRIAIEKTFVVGSKKKRFDILVFDTKSQPLLIVECKAPNVSINEKTFEQISTYNLSLHVTYWLVTNGRKHYCCYFSAAANALQLLEEIPDYTRMMCRND